MKLGLMKDRLAPSLARADRVFCFTEGLSWDAREALAPLGNRAICDNRLEALIEAIAREAHAGDRVLVMSNGGFGGIHGKLLERLAQA
jgi:UDP-N-acetylmuramate: L-alanyl-gamma-D-glutamyl-meso-diaminopimelate ligase